MSDKFKVEFELQYEDVKRDPTGIGLPDEGKTNKDVIALLARVMFDDFHYDIQKDDPEYQRKYPWMLRDYDHHSPVSNFRLTIIKKEEDDRRKKER